jgi:hypothetical protein
MGAIIQLEAVTFDRKGCWAALALSTNENPARDLFFGPASAKELLPRIFGYGTRCLERQAVPPQ